VSGLVQDRSAHVVVVRCSGVRDDGLCGREQAIESQDSGVGVRVASKISRATAAWLASFGWCQSGSRWLCPFCAGCAGDLL